jgi:RNA polymerase sigma factor (sigma-70 family)
MPANPETRESLILRLPSSADAQAWREFIELYEPLILRFARRRGLQEADAREIAQNVLIAVAKSVDRWQPDREKGKFRAWLFRIARNQVINWVSKRSSERCLSQESSFEELSQIESASEANSEIEMDYRREMFRLAASQVRDAFSESNWNAFWLTAVLGESIESTAIQLNRTPGSIYVARSRVIARIKKLVEQWEQNDAI